MLLPRMFAPVRASIASSSICSAPLYRILDALRPVNGPAFSPALFFVRHATHQTQGRANGAKDGPGKRLGAKKSGGEYVIPGNIIFRQRGTAWFPGENCKMGRDHCIFATEAGYVRYYRDPLKHPKRQYIGVVFEKHDTLPHPPHAARRRRLNMLAVRKDVQTPTSDEQIIVADLRSGDGTGHKTGIRNAFREQDSRELVMGKDYSYREANYTIGRVAERAKIEVKKFVPGDRFTAWQKSKVRKAASAERKRLRNAGKKTTKAKRKR